jgi:ABC-type amino acid transport system permease subunit
MTRELTLLLTLIAVGAGWALVHLMLLARASRAQRLSGRLRLIAWLPPATPVVAWLAGARALPILWLAHAVLYVWLRSLA